MNTLLNSSYQFVGDDVVLFADLQELTCAFPRSCFVQRSVMNSLPKGDCDKALRFQTQTLQIQSLLRTYATRLLLAEAIGESSHNIVIERSAKGKPHLVNSPWQFNVSYCDHWIAVAVSTHTIGLDIERSLTTDTKQTIKPFLNNLKQCLPTTAKSTTERWVALEAIGKALGSGLVTNWAKLSRKDDNQLQYSDRLLRYSSVVAPNSLRAGVCVQM